MKKTKIKSLLLLATLTTSLVLALTGCGSSSSEAQKSTSSTAASSAASSSTAADRTKIVIATGGMPKPFTYVNDKNELEGYDIEVVKAIFGTLPQYEISFEKTEFPSIFAGLDSDRYQVGANNFAMNEKRKEKYIYTNAIFKNQYVIAVKDDRTDIKSFADLQGKTTEVTAGVNYTTALENYNKDHTDKPVKLQYTEADLLPILQNVESGKYDFQLIDAAMLKNYINEYKLKIKTVVLSEEETKLIGAPFSYLLVSKGPNGEQLSKDINGALDKLVKDGTIGKISIKYFGDDFSPK